MGIKLFRSRDEVVCLQRERYKNFCKSKLRKDFINKINFKDFFVALNVSKRFHLLKNFFSSLEFIKHLKKIIKFNHVKTNYLFFNNNNKCGEDMVEKTHNLHDLIQVQTKIYFYKFQAFKLLKFYSKTVHKFNKRKDRIKGI